MNEDRTETVRFPTHLGREDILARLAQVRESARTAGVEELASFFAGVEDMPVGRIAMSVISALEWIEANPEHSAFAKNLSIVAMNLKNLK